MIKHIVMWKFKEHAEGKSKAENLLQAKAMLDDCAHILPGILKYETAIATTALENTYDLVLYSEFDNKGTLDAYQVHPEHQPAKSFISSVRLERQCMDYQVVA